MKRSSGPITVSIYEGSVKVAERTYVDTRRATQRLWPKWMTETFLRIDRVEAERDALRDAAQRVVDADNAKLGAPGLEGAEALREMMDALEELRGVLASNQESRPESER